MAELDAQGFFEGLSSENKPKEATQNSANRLSLNSNDMKGTIKLLPVVPDDFKGKPFIRIDGVRETFTKTSQNKKGYGWGYILPIEFYGKMTDEEVDLYNQVVTLWDEVDKIVHGIDPKDTSSLRKKNYTLIAGIILDHMDVEGKQIKTHIGKPSLLCYPSPTVYKTISESIMQQVQSLKGDVSIINTIFNNESTNREAALSIVFKWKDESNKQQGYSSTCNVEFNSRFVQVVDTDKDYGKSNIDILMNPMEVFLMWSYDHKNNKAFSVETFNEIRVSLLNIKKSIEESQKKVAAKLGGNLTEESTKEESKEKLSEAPSTEVSELSDAPF